MVEDLAHAKAKLVAQDIMDLDELIDDTLRALHRLDLEDRGLLREWYNEVDRLLNELPTQLYVVSNSLLAYAKAVDNDMYRVLKERLVLLER